jgi:hypothetical protein
MRYTLGEFMSEEDLKAELERLRNENASLKRGAATGIRRVLCPSMAWVAFL